MQKPFTTQRDLLVSTSDLDHPILHCLDDTEALLDWIGLDWIGVAWIGVDWIGLDWIGLDWIGLE
jgi:hypothetical protein